MKKRRDNTALMHYPGNCARHCFLLLVAFQVSSQLLGITRSKINAPGTTAATCALPAG
jgi:hypothetical protein